MSSSQGSWPGRAGQGLCAQGQAERLHRRCKVQGIYGNPVRYSSALDCARQIVAQQGVRGLYRGLAGSVLKVRPEPGLPIRASCRCWQGRVRSLGDVCFIWVWPVAGGTLHWLHVRPVRPSSCSSGASAACACTPTARMRTSLLLPDLSGPGRGGQAWAGWLPNSFRPFEHPGSPVARLVLGQHDCARSAAGCLDLLLCQLALLCMQRWTARSARDRPLLCTCTYARALHLVVAAVLCVSATVHACMPG